jgi:hypothetical protein
LIASSLYRAAAATAAALFFAAPAAAQRQDRDRGCLERFLRYL